MATRELESGYFPVNAPATAPEPPTNGGVERYAQIGDKLRISKHHQKVRIIPHNDANKDHQETENYYTIEVVPKESDTTGIFMNITSCLTGAS